MNIRRRAVTIVIAGILLCLPASAQANAVRAERELFNSVNLARQAQGLAPLKWDDALAAAARRHAEVMAEHGAAQHGFEGEPGLSSRARQAGVRFTWLSENVMQGARPEFIHTGFMKSPPHRGNILDTDMDSIGVGVVEHQGQLFAVEDFSKAR